MLIQQLSLSIAAVIFLAAGFQKIAQSAHFRLTLIQLPYFPYKYATFISYLVPVIEVAVGFGLVANWAGAKLAAVGMLVVFSWMIWIVISRNLRIPCNCFGAENDEVMSRAHLVRNAGLISLVMVTSRSEVLPGVSSMCVALSAVLLFGAFKALRRNLQFSSSRTGSQKWRTGS